MKVFISISPPKVGNRGYAGFREGNGAFDSGFFSEERVNYGKNIVKPLPSFYNSVVAAVQILSKEINTHEKKDTYIHRWRRCAGT